MSMTPNSKYLVFGTRNNNIKILLWPEKTEHWNITVHNNWVRNLAVTKDNIYFVSCSADKTVRLFNIMTKTEEFN